YNDIGDAAQLAVLDAIHLLLRMPVAMPETDFGIHLDLIRVQKSPDRVEKIMRDLRLGNCRRIARNPEVSWIDIHAENFLHPWKETRKLFTAQFVTRAADDDVAVLVDIEMRVPESPHVQAFRFARVGRRWRLRDHKGSVRARSGPQYSAGFF